MAFTESFRTYPRFDEKEVFELIGLPEPVRRLRPSKFEGPVAHWANDRMRRFGETIVPKQVVVEQPPYKKPHRVAWVYHEGLNDAGEPFCMHHVACDCSGDVDRVDSFDEKQKIIDNCPALIPAINKQADLINATYRIDDILSALSYDPESCMEEQNSEIQLYVTRSMIYLLERDYRHPEEWLANVESGWTLTNLMARIFKISPEDIEWLAEALAFQDDAEFDGGCIGLSQKQKDLIDVERRLNDILIEQGM